MSDGHPSAVRKYRCALVTGASSGIGAEFARQLAPDCESMVLVARRGELLEKLAAELSASGTTCYCVAADLTSETERAALADGLRTRGRQPDLLVNNAGMGDYGDFAGAEWQKLDAMLQLNVTALTHLCHLFLPGMIGQRSGAVINVSSLASTLPIPDFAVYAATKAYVSSFSEALRLELRGHGIPVLAVCPGPVHTNFGKVAIREGGKDAFSSRELVYVTAEKVVADSLRALGADRARVFPGWKVAALAAGISLLPMCALRLILTKGRGSI